MKVTDYLVRSSHFHEEGWKIVNKAVHGGYVYLDADEIVRLVRNELGNLIYEKIRAMTLSNVPQPIGTRRQTILRSSSDLLTKINCPEFHIIHRV